MEAFLESNFWSDQVAKLFGAWAALLPSLVLVFWLGFGLKSRTRPNAEKEDLESRLRLVRDQNIDESKMIEDVRSRIVELRHLIKTRVKRRDLEMIILEAEKATQALQVINRTTDHILSAEKPAMGD